MEYVAAVVAGSRLDLHVGELVGGGVEVVAAAIRPKVSNVAVAELNADIY